jgi:hypothetical protein
VSVLRLLFWSVSHASLTRRASSLMMHLAATGSRPDRDDVAARERAVAAHDEYCEAHGERHDGRRDGVTARNVSWTLHPACDTGRPGAVRVCGPANAVTVDGFTA